MNKQFGFLLFLLFLCFSCNSGEKKTVVDFNGPAPVTSTVSFHEDAAIHVGIATIISPKETFTYYNDLLSFISSKLGMPVHYLQKESFQEMNDLLEKGAVDFAFIGTGAYIEAKKRGIARLLVAPVSEGSSTYKVYIIANKKSGIRNFGDFKGKNFAYTDPFSHAGHNYALSRVNYFGYRESDFFAKTLFTYGNDLSCEMVNRGIIDGASVSSTVFEYLKRYYPEKVKNIVVVEISKEFPIPPVVVSNSVSDKKYKLYENIFLNLHKDIVGKQILEQINIERFVQIDDSEYDEVRQIRNKVKK